MNRDNTLIPLTEQRNPHSMNLDDLATLEMVRLMNREDARVPLAIAEVLPQIAAAIDVIAAALAAGGRLFYQGAGTSGRLAVLDAVELLPTFSVAPGLVIPLLAGGDTAMMRSVEGAEDSADQGKAELVAHGFSMQDVLVAVAASGRTPYALGGLHHAAEIGAATIALVCNPDSPMTTAAQIGIAVVTGPEVLTGSTRLKAGTAQKLVLNMISTCVMVKLGKVYGNLMVDVQPTNAKLRQRAVRIVCDAADVDAATAQKLLQRANGAVKVAVVMALTGAEVDEAQQRLVNVHGHVRPASNTT